MHARVHVSLARETFCGLVPGSSVGRSMCLVMVCLVMTLMREIFFRYVLVQGLVGLVVLGSCLVVLHVCVCEQI